nr:DUF6147 family protein [uncultured Blautia sp.]
MSYYKKLSVIVFSMILFLGLGINVYAADFQRSGERMEDSELIKSNVSTVSLENSARGNILNNGTASIANNGNGVVNVSGAVLGGVICDKLVLKLTLQRYSNGVWKDVKYFSDTKYNHSLLTKSYNVSVTKGYYYRVKAACVATKGSITESKSPVTDGIWIN